MKIEDILIRISAVIGMPAAKKSIVEIAYSYFKQSFTRKDIELEFEKLRTQKKFSGPPFSIPAKTVEPIIHELIELGEFSPLAELVIAESNLFYFVQQYSYQEGQLLKGNQECIQLCRILFLSGDFKKLSTLLNPTSKRNAEILVQSRGQIYGALAPYLYSINLSKLNADLYRWLAEEAAAAFVLHGTAIDPKLNQISETVSSSALQLAIVQGDQTQIDKILKVMNSSSHKVISLLAHAVSYYFVEDYAAAISKFEEQQKQMKKLMGTTSGFLDGAYGILYFFSLIRTKNEADRQKAKKYLARIVRPSVPQTAYWPIFELLHQLVPEESDKFFYYHHQGHYSSPFITFFSRLIDYWNDPEYLKKSVKLNELKKTYDTCLCLRSHWMIHEIGHLIKALDADFAFSSSFTTSPICSIMQIKGAWEKTLNQLEELLEIKGESKKKESRLTWALAVFADYHGIETGRFSAKEQTLSKNGTWTKGKLLTAAQLKAYALGDECDLLDRKIIGHIDVRGNNSRSTVFDEAECFPLLAEHPLLFELHQGTSEIKLELETGEFQVLYKHHGMDLHLSLGPEGIDFSPLRSIYWEKTGPHRYRYTEILPEQQKLVSLIGYGGLKIPLSEKTRVERLISGLTKLVPIHTNEEVGQISLPEVQSSAVIHVYCSFVNQMLEVSLWIKPFHDSDSMVRPTAGQMRMINHKSQYQAIRDLSAEKNNLGQVRNVISRFIMADDENEYDYYCSDLELALEILFSLKQLETDGVVSVLWPKGEGLKSSRTMLDYSHLKLRMSKRNTWFELQGEIDFPLESTLSLVELILSAKQTAMKQFVQLDDGTYIKLSQELKKELELLSSKIEGKKNDLAFDQASLLAHKKFISKLHNVDPTNEVNTFYQKVEDVYNTSYQPPSTFKATLRDYQHDGFEWMKRLSELQFGACLSDDMGLGKTVQGISILLDRAPLGPSLVVAPVSVLMNWIDELRRFAPTLNVISMREGEAKKRKNMLEELGPMDVVLVSYGILQRETSIFDINWNAIILDEAQAIKNHQTKRAACCFSLKGDFKLITTGTPIENHLGELWSLFHFINPGLLGDFKAFTKRYMGGAEQGLSSKSSFTILKKIIAPYLLRRKKADVLSELPEKTEIVLRAEMSGLERDFYEALRIKAIETIKTETNPGKRMVKMLTELTRLRQAACHPRLISNDLDYPSAKLELFNGVLEEILDSGHKVLVFSQFVRFLKMIESELIEKGISYQYLDGSTTQKNRQKAVENFQRGVGDVFLISLRAGGVGLNLTAADYVIHMDPWWNPAVENQATDRVHRIGQVNPVTVYKIVTENTVEEKVITLHGQKLELAKGLLDGNESGTKLDPAFMMELLS